MKHFAINSALALLVCCGRVLAQGGPQGLPAVIKPAPPPPAAPVSKPAASSLPPVVKPATPAPPVVMPATPAPLGMRPATSGKVWGALIYATEGKPVLMPDSVPADLKDLPRRLGQVFKYSRFEILGNHTQDVFRQYESWVVPSRELFLKLDSKGPAPGGGLKVDLQFWRLDKVLVKTDTVLRPQSPLFIGGPRWREGRLIFVLLLTERDVVKKGTMAVPGK